ncbi:hypothetical protein CANCADRAFT_17972, partial [Tortispora caseinolytica NRRL Y-17796]
VMEEFDIHDPEFTSQWHIMNPTDRRFELKVVEVWRQNITGQGVVVALVDDGVDMRSPDIADNFFLDGSYDFNDHMKEPQPKLRDDRHGTRCAGEVAAVRNNFCGVGVAYNAKVAGIRILSKPISDADEALSLNYAMDVNDIYSCSWGPRDDGKTLEGPSELIRRAFKNGVEKGRQGKGSIFVFASGNGGSHGDNCNFDGYTNSIYSITIGAIDHKGLHPHYSEDCSALLTVCYSSGSGEFIHTTDLKETCTNQHGGTSAAAPLASGVFALVLSARPDLTWRDLQYIAIEGSTHVDNPDAKWQKTAAGRLFSHRYGYGKMDASRMIEIANAWKLVGPQTSLVRMSEKVNLDIPATVELNDALTSVITITEEDVKAASLARLEHVNVFVDIEHAVRGDVSVYLVSPENVISEIAPFRKRDNSPDGMRNWTFMSVAHWGESGIGNWTLRAVLENDRHGMGKLNHWGLTLWGESAQA